MASYDYVTFSPRSRNRYRCEQTGKIVTKDRLNAYRNTQMPRKPAPKAIEPSRKKQKFGYPSHWIRPNSY